jgi:Rap1a immunity proteins
MGKIIGFALLFALTAAGPALADGNWAAEFALKTCLPAMDDLATVEATAKENNWSRYPPISLANPTLAAALKTQIHWSATHAGKKFSVYTGTNPVAGIFPYCGIEFNDVDHHNNISRDEFFATISASLELKMVSDGTYIRLRVEYYDVETGAYENVRISIKTQLNGPMTGVSFYKVVSSASGISAANAEDVTVKDAGTANYLLPYCRLTPVQIENDGHRASMNEICIGMIKTARSILSLGKFGHRLGTIAGGSMLCADIPESVSPEQAMRVLVRYGDLHPEEMHLSVLSFALKALSLAWPCGEWRPSFPPDIIREQ